MPQKKSSRRLIGPLLLFSLAGWALWALGRNEPARAAAQADPGPDRPRERETSPVQAVTRARATWSKRRMATSLAFVTLFFAGAAFSAGAGDAVVEALEGTTSTETTSTEEEASEEQAPAEEPAEEPAESEEPASEEPASEEPASEEPAPSEGEDSDGSGGAGGSEQPNEEPADEGGNGGGTGNGGGGDEPSEPSDGQSGEQPSGNTGGDPSGETGQSGGDEGEAPGAPNLDEGDDAPAPEPGSPLLPGNAPEGPSQLDPEADAEGFFATVWLHRTMPDPTPPAKRLTPLFAKTLAREARLAKVDWALVLGVLRAQGFDGGTMSTTAVRQTAERLVALGARRNAWRAAMAYRGRTAFADRAVGLTRYNRAVGLNALVSGLQAAKPSLRRKVLADRRLSIYSGGRLDIAMGRTDVRILVLMEYLAEAHRRVTVSSLTTGHRIYSRPGVVSAHTYGLAVDIAALDGRSIAGNQGPNGMTERAVRNILLLPAELQPRQVISLLGLGGPSFPMANHWDHIHVGY